MTKKIEGALLEEFKKVMRGLADDHPKPDEPILSIGRTVLTHRNIAEGLEKDTEEGRAFLRFVERGTDGSGMTPRDVLNSFRNDIKKKGPQNG